MGKAADNEKIKIKAAFSNNVAVGLLVATFFVPAFALLFNFKAVYDRIEALIDRTATAVEIGASAAAVIGIAVAFWGAYRLHEIAQQELDQLQD